MDTDDVNFSESPNYFTAVQITRPVFLESKESIKKSPVNHIKVAKLVLEPKPVRIAKAKTPIKRNNQRPSSRDFERVSDKSKVQVVEALASSQNKTDDDADQLMKKRDIELERIKIPKATEHNRKTLNVQRTTPVQSPVVNKSKMDEGARCEARKFMKKQREKRKMEVKKEVDKSYIIKQRLQELRKHTKDALTKKPNASPVKPSPPVESSYYSLTNHKLREIKVLKLKPMTKEEAGEPPKEKVEEIPLTECNINIPKSPIMQQLPVRNQASVSPMKLSPNRINSPVRVVDKKRQSSQPSTRPSSAKENKKSDNNNDLRLIVPDVKLSMLNTSTKQILNRSDLSTVHNQTFVKPHSNNIPSWLQNSIIQPYPYNFIWAVRKKLEALATQPKNENNKHTHYDLETPLIKRNKKLAKARRLHQNLIIAEDDNDSETNAKSEDIELPSEANTISEISSIKSDIVGEQKSQPSIERQSSVKNDNDETTISESIFHSISDDKFIGKKRESVNSEFDRASFDKKLQALGPENVSPNTTVKKNNFLSSTLKSADNQVPKIEEAIFKKPDIPSHANSTAKNELNDLDNNNKVNEDKEEEFKKMLLAFNKSLSHVVEVNHLLSAALVSKSSSTTSSHASVSIKSSQPASMLSSKRDSEHDNRYSSSFEKNIESSEKTSNISEMIENIIHADTKQQQTVGVNEENSEENSSIQTLIADSEKVDEAIEDPPIAYQSEQPHELTSSTTKITLTKTDNNLQEVRRSSKKNVLEVTLNESNLINMFRLSESEVSFVESFRSDQPDGGKLFIKSTSEIKSWERSLIERTRGQIAWLELQKLNFKKHGHFEKVSTIKKQQRAILLRLEKERIKMREENNSQSDKLIDQAVEKLETSMDLTGNDSDVKECIERILQQREQKIIQRRKKIEHLLSWQRRLDDEEKKLKYLERELLNANKNKSTVKSPRKKSSGHDLLDTSYEMVKSIDHSLKILDHDVIARDDEKVEIIGSKMNKLWYRLTGMAIEKFIPKRIYQLTKIEIAKFYEDAKEAVLESDLKLLLESSSVISPVKPEMKKLNNDNSRGEDDDDDVEKLDEEKKTFSRSDTMNSIANIETEEEYPNSYTNEQTATQSENDDELQQLMANQMKVFVDHKALNEDVQVREEYKPLIAPSLIAAAAVVNDKTFQVQNTQKDESKSSNINNESISTANIEEIEEIEEESEMVITEPAESNEISEAFEEFSMILDTHSTSHPSHVIQITDMDQDEDNENIQMIENISFPNLEISLSDTLQNDFDNDRGHDLSTITECTEYEQGSSGPISSEIITNSSTPTTSERLNSEIQQRLLSINDSLEQVEEAFKKVPLVTAASSVTYSTDRDFVETEKMASLEGEEEENQKSDLLLSTPTSESGSQLATSTPKVLMPDLVSDAESLK